jgi:hypothetical protein
MAAVVVSRHYSCIADDVCRPKQFSIFHAKHHSSIFSIITSSTAALTKIVPPEAAITDLLFLQFEDPQQENYHHQNNVLPRRA